MYVRPINAVRCLQFTGPLDEFTKALYADFGIHPERLEIAGELLMIESTVDYAEESDKISGCLLTLSPGDWLLADVTLNLWRCSDADFRAEYRQAGA